MSYNPKVSIITSLYNCERFISSYFDCVEKLNHTDDIEILLLHNQPKESEMLIIKDRLTSLPFVRHILIPERESLYQTWNRGVLLSKGEYLCVWNVDDIRLPDSVFEQKVTLDNNADASMTYGDLYYMYTYGVSSADLVDNPDFSLHKKEFLKNHSIGCFPMWRKSIHEKFGYFDEQFFLVGDYDFQIRLSLYSRLVKTESVLGYYLENDSGKLSMNSEKQIREINMVNLRYGIYDRLNWLLVPGILSKYNINKAKYNEEFYPIRMPRFYRLKRSYLLLLSVIYQPRMILSLIKHRRLKL